MLKSVRSVVLGAAVLACATGRLDAQSPADKKEIAAYRLTAAALKKYDVVADHLVAMVKSNPEIQAHIRLQAAADSLRKKDELTEKEQERLEKIEEQLAKLEESDDDDSDDDDESISATTKKLTSHPAMASALAKAGFAPREFVVFSLAMFQASAYAQMKKQGMQQHIPKDASAAQIAFAEQNAAAFQASLAKLDKAGKFRNLMKKGS